MGKQVEAAALERGHTVVAKVDPASGEARGITAKMAQDSDCAIEFSVPKVVIENAAKYCELGLSAVVGTTGWYDQLEAVRSVVLEAGTAYLYGPNFSIGAHLFFRLVSHAAQSINPLPDYDIFGYELHHRYKKDSPSGTALRIANVILEKNKTKTTLATEKLNRQIEGHELHFASVRGGEIPGIHKVILDSQADTIELTHTVRNRKGFALGAVLAAEWLQTRSGFYTVDDFIDKLLELEEKNDV